MRTDFVTFLSEQAKIEETEGKQLKHLTHTEDMHLHGGNDGIEIADQHLRGMHDMLLGKRAPLHATTKYDGAPAVVFGKHPETGQFFVASKSAFNKTPKINYTEEDIDKNHGHAPGLAAKLKAALKHLPGIMPKTSNKDDVYQGDLMHTTGDATTKKGVTSITPNTLTYSAPADSAEGKNMKKPFGIVVHTHYKGGRGNLQSMVAGPLDDKRRAAFRDHPDVNNIDPRMDINPGNYSPEEQHAFMKHMDAAKKTYSSMKPEAMDALAGHGQHIEAHINDMIRTGGTPSVEGYINHLQKRHQKDIESVKTDAAKQKKAAAHAQVMQHVINNKDHFDKALQLHGHLQAAKNVLVGVMGKNSPYQHSVMGEPTGPEGTVVVDKAGNASKMNNRQEFNRLNFLKGAFQKQKIETNA